MLLFNDIVEGTRIETVGQFTVITVAQVPFSKLTMRLDDMDVENLLAVREGAVNPAHDIAEFFRDVYHCQERAAMRAAEAFVATAAEIADAQ